MSQAVTAPSRDAGWTPLRIIVVALCFLLNMLDGADLLVMSFVAPVLARDWTISPERLGMLFSASLAGMAIGCVLIAPLADRVGRRVTILAALTLVATAMVASGYTRDLAELMLARLLVGIGVGTIGVGMTAMAAEFAPPRHAGFAVGLVQAGWPFSSIVTALLLAHLLPAIGWQLPMIAIGVASIAVLFVAAAALPESPALLIARGTPAALATADRLVARLGGPPPAPATIGSAGRGPGALFAPAIARDSVLLWGAVTLGYFDLYFVISWIPKLATQAGLALDDAIYAGATYNLGAFLGTTAIGLAAIRFRLTRAIPAFLAVGAVAMIVFGVVGLPVWATLLVAAAIGVTVQGGFNGFWGLATQLYHPSIRGLGIGWALGFGRVGAVLGPAVGGALVGQGVPSGAIFLLFAIPLCGAAVATLAITDHRPLPSEHSDAAFPATADPAPGDAAPVQ